MNRIIHLMFLFYLSFTANAQIDVEFIESEDVFTSLSSHPSGQLICGTKSGQIYLYDGRQFDDILHVDSEILSIRAEKELIEVVTASRIIEISDKIPNTRNKLSGIDVWLKNKESEIVLTNNSLLHKNGLDFIPESSSPTITESSEKKLILHDEIYYLSIDSLIYRYTSKWRFWKKVPFIISDLASSGNNLFASGDKGLFLLEDHSTKQVIFQGNSINVPISRLLTSGDIIVYATEEGINMLNQEAYTQDKWRISRPSLEEMEIDSWGNYWLIVSGQLVKITGQSGNTNPPIFSFINMRLGYQPIIRSKSSVVLEKEENDLGFDYKATFMGNPGAILYQFQLEGKDDGWSSWSDKTSSNYTNLDPGNYKFYIRTSIDRKHYNTSEIIDIKIKDDPIASFWYFISGVSLSLILLTWYSSSRLNVLKERNRREVEQLRTQNKMLSFQQKSLQLQMNPHFIFNALNSIQGLIDKDDNRNARNYLKEFSAMMRMVLQQSRADNILLEEEIKYLTYFLSLEQMTRNHTFNFTIQCDESVEDDLKIPPMIIQPFVENAIIHGVGSLKGKQGNITINFSQRPNYLLCKIEDNGVGRSVSAKVKSSTHESVAIFVVEERLANLFKNKNEKYVDLNDPMNGGLIVSIKIPYV